MSGWRERAKDLKPGDYVFASKYEDGDPLDGYAIGFYDGTLAKVPVRYMVVDADGNQFRGNGFRRVQKVSTRRGNWLVDHWSEMEASCRSVWWWARRRMEP